MESWFFLPLIIELKNNNKKQASFPTPDQSYQKQANKARGIIWYNNFQTRGKERNAGGTTCGLSPGPGWAQRKQEDSD